MVYTALKSPHRMKNFLGFQGSLVVWKWNRIPITKGPNDFWSPLLRALRAIAQIFKSQIWIKITKHHFFSMKNWTFQCRLEPSRSKVQFRILVQSWGV